VYVPSPLIGYFRDIYSQAQMLVARMKADSAVNIDKDWKMVTLFIGGNDLCAFCKDSVSKLKIKLGIIQRE